MLGVWVHYEVLLLFLCRFSPSYSLLNSSPLPPKPSIHCPSQKPSQSDTHTLSPSKLQSLPAALPVSPLLKKKKKKNKKKALKRRHSETNEPITEPAETHKPIGTSPEMQEEGPLAEKKRKKKKAKRKKMEGKGEGQLRQRPSAKAPLQEEDWRLGDSWRLTTATHTPTARTSPSSQPKAQHTDTPTPDTHTQCTTHTLEQSEKQRRRKKKKKKMAATLDGAPDGAQEKADCPTSYGPQR